MWSKVDHRAVFVRLLKPATNQFTVESFQKEAAGGFLNPPPTDGLIFHGSVTLFVE